VCFFFLFWGGGGGGAHGMGPQCLPREQELVPVWRAHHGDLVWAAHINTQYPQKQGGTAHAWAVSWGYSHLWGLGSGNKLVIGSMLDSLSCVPCGHEKESCSPALINPSPLPNPWVEEDVGSKRLSSFARPCTPLSRIVILNLKIARRFH